MNLLIRILFKIEVFLNFSIFFLGLISTGLLFVIITNSFRELSQSNQNTKLLGSFVFFEIQILRLSRLESVSFSPSFMSVYISSFCSQ